MFLATSSQLGGEGGGRLKMKDPNAPLRRLSAAVQAESLTLGVHQPPFSASQRSQTVQCEKQDGARIGSRFSECISPPVAAAKVLLNLAPQTCRKFPTVFPGEAQ